MFGAPCHKENKTRIIVCHFKVVTKHMFKMKRINKERKTKLSCDFYRFVIFNGFGFFLFEFRRSMN